MAIYDEEEGVEINEMSVEKPQPEAELRTHLGGKEIIQLKNNSFPKGLVPLEELFDNNVGSLVVPMLKYSTFVS